MSKDNEDPESEVLKEMFGEIMKMIHEKRIKLESIIQYMADQDWLQQDTFDRINKILTEHGKRKQWL